MCSQKVETRNAGLNEPLRSPHRVPLLFSRQVVPKQSVQPVGDLSQFLVFLSEEVLHDRVIPSGWLDLTLIVDDDEQVLDIAVILQVGSQACVAPCRRRGVRGGRGSLFTDGVLVGRFNELR